MTLSVPIIETHRLKLRAPELRDYDALGDFFADPRSAFNGGPKQRHEMSGVLFSSIGAWALRGYGIWHITLKDDDRFVGFAGIFHPVDFPEPELGYGIAAEYEGKGIAFEAVKAARHAAATHFGLTALPSFVSPDNTRSQALAARLGAVREQDITLRGKRAHVWRHPEVPV